MAPDIAFMKKESEASFSDDMSNQESFPSFNGKNLDFSRCAFFGNKFFETALAEMLFQDPSNRNMDGEWLSRQLVQETFEFPYARFIVEADSLHNTHVPGDSGTNAAQQRHVCMTKIGLILAKGSMNARKRLMSLVQTRAGTTPNQNQMESTLPTSPEPSSDSDGGDRVGMSRYTMMLHEWAARENKQISWTPKHLSLDPPKWQMVLKVDGNEYVGKGYTKKEAKHIAAKQAAEDHGLDHEHTEFM